MAFRVGMKVVCVDAKGQELFLVKDAIYTITSISPCGIYVRVDATRSGYYRERFRPVVERKTDISCLQALLVPGAKISEDA